MNKIKEKEKKHRHKWIKDYQDDCPNCGWCGVYKICECGEVKLTNK